MSWRISTHSPSEMENSIKEIRGSVWVSCKRAQMIWRCYGATCMGTLTYGVVTEAIQNLPIPDQRKETELFWSDSDIFSRIFKIVIVLTVNNNFAFQKLHVETISKKEWVENHIHTAFEGLRSYWQVTVRGKCLYQPLGPQDRCCYLAILSHNLLFYSV